MFPFTAPMGGNSAVAPGGPLLSAQGMQQQGQFHGQMDMQQMMHQQQQMMSALQNQFMQVMQHQQHQGPPNAAHAQAHPASGQHTATVADGAMGRGPPKELPPGIPRNLFADWNQRLSSSYRYLCCVEANGVKQTCGKKSGSPSSATST